MMASRGNYAKIVLFGAVIGNPAAVATLGGKDLWERASRTGTGLMGNGSKSLYTHGPCILDCPEKITLGGQYATE